jgi:hypothetical protein
VLRNQISFTLCLISGTLIGMLLPGCGLTLNPQPAPLVPSQIHSLRAASAWVTDRMARDGASLEYNDRLALERVGTVRRALLNFRAAQAIGVAEER